MSTALNDLLTTSKWIVGDEENHLFEKVVSDVERLYLLRLSIAQLHEVRESVKHGRKEEQVELFLEALPESARQDLDRLLTVNTIHDNWILGAMTHVRNQTSHYGGKWNWDDLKWAIKQVADDDGEIEMVNERLVGMRLKFAANQHLTGKFPEYAADPDAELDQETKGRRVGTLFQAMAEVTAAAQNFATVAVKAYLDRLPNGMVRAEN